MRKNVNKRISSYIFRSFVTPFSTILFCLALLSSLTQKIFLFLVILLSGLIHFTQELRAKIITDKLLKLVNTKVKVLKDNKVIEISSEQLKLDDKIVLEAGDRIPADVKLLETSDFFVSQSVITGESGIVEKNATNTAFSGTSVVGGRAVAKVIALGKSTVYGNLAINNVVKKRRFDEGAKSISIVLVKFMAILLPIVFLILGITKGLWLRAFVFSLSVAIGLTPELLPMVISACLAKASSSLYKKKTIVKNINAMQALGSMDVLCVDKTGTLTKDEVILEYYLDILGNESQKVLDFAYLNSYYHTGAKNHLDRAVLKCENAHLKKLVNEYSKIDEIPFNNEKKYASVQVNDLIILKGAYKEILKKCSYIEYKGKIIEIEDDKQESVRHIVDEMTEDGMRVLAICYKKTNKKYIDDEDDYILLGYISFFDAPKSSATSSISKLNNLNIDIRILTGDNKGTTIAVCKRIGIKCNMVLTGEQIDKLDGDDVYTTIESTNIFVELSPKHKAKIVEILQKNGHFVGFLGDGMNDLPAQLKANVSISVDNAVTALKDSADIVLLKKDLNILEDSIIEGRKAFVNMVKYIKITASSNFGNICAIVCASIFLPFYPITSVQILLVNTLYDILCLILPWDNVDKELIKRPLEWSGKTLERFMIYFGPLSLIFDILTFFFLYKILAPSVAGTNYKQVVSICQTGWFLETLWTQVLILHLLRTEKIPFIQSKPSKLAMFTTISGLILLSLLTISPLGNLIGFTTLPFSYYIFLAVIVLSYMILVTIFKIFYVRKYKKLL